MGITAVPITLILLGFVALFPATISPARAAEQPGKAQVFTVTTPSTVSGAMGDMPGMMGGETAGGASHCVGHASRR